MLPLHIICMFFLEFTFIYLLYLHYVGGLVFVFAKPEIFYFVIRRLFIQQQMFLKYVTMTTRYRRLRR